MIKVLTTLEGKTPDLYADQIVKIKGTHNIYSSDGKTWELIGGEQDMDELATKLDQIITLLGLQATAVNQSTQIANQGTIIVEQSGQGITLDSILTELLAQGLTLEVSLEALASIAASNKLLNNLREINEHLSAQNKLTQEMF